MLLVSTILITYLGVCVGIFVCQRSLIYYPTQSLPVDPPKTISMKVDDAILKISAHELKSENAIIYFGGNAETVSQSLPKYVKAFPDFAVYMPHYRGYSGSTGSPTEAALHRDAEKLYEFIKEKHSKITVIGRSLGSGVAVRLAAFREVNRLVLVTPFDSLLSLAKQKFPALPVNLMLKDKFESWHYAPKIKAPTLILAAEFDTTIPKENSRALFDAFKPGIAKLKVIKGADHISISGSPEYFPLMQSD